MSGLHRSGTARRDRKRVTASLHIRLPRNHSPMEGLSRAYPHLRFAVLGLQVDRNQLFLDLRVPFEASTPEIEGYLRRHPMSVKVRPLLSPPYGGVLRLITKRPDPSLYGALFESRFIPEIPFHFADGVVSITSITSPATATHTLEVFKENFPGTTLGPVRPGIVLGPEQLLTRRQSEVFHVALTEGYWDVPRRTTLTRLALQLNMSKSSLSETLSGVERKVLHEMADRVLAEDTEPKFGPKSPETEVPCPE